MERQISCEFNIDTACVEVKYADGSMISILKCNALGEKSVAAQRVLGLFFAG